MEARQPSSRVAEKNKNDLNIGKGGDTKTVAWLLQGVDWLAGTVCD